MSLLSRIVNVFRSDRLTRDIDAELAAHLEEATEQGRDPTEVRRALGSSLRLREASRDVRIIAWLDSLRADVIFGWRQLLKRKTTAAAAILSLGLAMGACTSAFRLIDALFLRPLPIAHPERLFALTLHGTRPDGKGEVSDSSNYPLFRQITAAVHSDADPLAISYSGPWSVTYGSDQDLEPAYGEYVSGRMFAVFGLRPAAGRLLSEDEDAMPGHPYAVLSFDYWTRRFGRDSKVIGRSLHFGRNLFTIVGVAPKGFTGIEPGSINDIFLPVPMNSMIDNPDAQWLRTIIMVKPGVAPERVREQIQAVVRAFWQERLKAHPEVPPGIADLLLNQRAVLDSAPSGVSGMQRDYRESLVSLAMLVALVLLIACANVANLMIAQAAARSREMALRVSIGAGRARLAQLVLVETALLGIFAASVGAAFAWWAAPFVVARINPPDHPARLILPADWRILGFTCALTLLVMLLYGLAPALRASRVKPASALRGGEDPHARRRLMRALVAAQTAFCFLVLFVAGLFVTTFRRLSNQPLGFSADRLLALEVISPDSLRPSDWNRLLDAVQAAPGVEKAAAAGWPLVSGTVWNNPVSVDSKPFGPDFSDFLGISRGWIETMKIPLLAGRDFRPDESDAGEVAVVNQAFAELYFKGDDVLGKTFETPRQGTRVKSTIVGLVANARYANMREAMAPVAYLPIKATPGSIGELTLMVRTGPANPLMLTPTLRRAISIAMPGLRLNDVNTQQELIDTQTIRERLLAMLAFFFAVVALLLAGVGLYGVLDYSVLQRRCEIGIRMAVGAPAGRIVRLVTFDILAWVIAGTLAGLALGITSARYLESLLYQVKSTGLGALAAPALALLAAAVLASLPPIIRAVRIDPMNVLRSD